MQWIAWVHSDEGIYFQVIEKIIESETRKEAFIEAEKDLYEWKNEKVNGISLVSAEIYYTRQKRR